MIFLDYYAFNKDIEKYGPSTKLAKEINMKQGTSVAL